MLFGFFFLLVVLAALTGNRYKPGDWYSRLQKPSWTPANWVFPVVWLCLYIAIALAGWLVARQDMSAPALIIWCGQLVFNMAWSYLFFGRRSARVALIDIFLLWLSILMFIGLAWPVSPIASFLFLPYLAWVSIAMLLNREIIRMNPREFGLLAE